MTEGMAASAAAEAGSFDGTCETCGGHLLYDPAAGGLHCVHCGARVRIVPAGTPIVPLPWQMARAEPAAEQALEVLVHTCRVCGATVTLYPGVASGRCPFCAEPFVDEARSRRLFKPQGVVPLRIDRERALDIYHRWMGRLTFAPNALRHAAIASAFTPVYVPFWAFSCSTQTAYSGRRGVDRTESSTTTSTDASGNTQSQTTYYTVTDWHSTSGAVARAFKDVLVVASRTLGAREKQRMEPWDLAGIVPYQPEFLLGSIAETYSVDVPGGWQEAARWMGLEIDKDIRRDIGGDHQQITGKQTRYEGVVFLQFLLPVWIAAYTFEKRSYRLLVNGQTGEIWGQRPYSVLKIVGVVLLVVGLLCLIPILFLIFGSRG